MNRSVLDLRRIVQFANLADSPEERTQRIVDSVCEAVGTDICSLYAVDTEGKLVLLASHGLSMKPNVVIPHGMGLVGLVARGQHLLNVEDASLHSGYH